jgi:hypothetical protein
VLGVVVVIVVVVERLPAPVQTTCRCCLVATVSADRLLVAIVYVCVFRERTANKRREKVYQWCRRRSWWIGFSNDWHRSRLSNDERERENVTTTIEPTTKTTTTHHWSRHSSRENDSWCWSGRLRRIRKRKQLLLATRWQCVAVKR